VGFEIAYKYCILNSFVDYEDYSISSKGYLPTVVYIMVIWIICPLPSILVPWFLECWCSVLPSPIWPLPICLDSWTWHSLFLCNIFLYSIGLYFDHHNLALFPLWLNLFIPSGAISPVLHSFPEYWAPSNLGSSSFSVISFCLFILFMGLSEQECWSALAFPSPVDHVLSELSTMTRLSWVALHDMAHSFIEFDKSVIHVICLGSVLWLWFSFCLPCDGWG